MLRVAEAERGQIAVWSTAGTLVRTLPSCVQEAGCYKAAWEGRDERGREARAGVYLIRLKVDGLTATRKLVVQR